MLLPAYRTGKILRNYQVNLLHQLTGTKIARMQGLQLAQIPIFLMVVFTHNRVLTPNKLNGNYFVIVRNKRPGKTFTGRRTFKILQLVIVEN